MQKSCQKIKNRPSIIEKAVKNVKEGVLGANCNKASDNAITKFEKNHSNFTFCVKELAFKEITTTEH